MSSLMIAAFYTPDPSRKAELINQVRDACRDHGFFQIVNHRVPPSLCDSILQQAQELFSLPLEIKEKYSKGMHLDNHHI